MSNFLEIASAYQRGEISDNDPRIKQAEALLQKMANTEDGRQEIAEVIGMYIQQNWNKFDIAPYITKNKNFRLGDRPEFRLKKKGIKAYWIAPNSSTPKSRNYQETLTMEFDSISVRPECLLDELKAGRVTSLQELLVDSKEAVENAIAGKVFTILGQVYNETKNKENYFKDTSKLTKETLNKAIDRIKYKTGRTPVLIGDMMLINQIRDFEGYTEATKHSIEMTGAIATYRGCPILEVSECIDPVDGTSLVPKDRLYIVSDNIGYSGTYAEPKSGQEQSIEDWTWNARIDREWGMTVTEPNGMVVVEVK